MKKQYSVYITLLGAGLSCDDTVEDAAGMPADGSGCCLMTHDRDFDWSGLTHKCALALAERVQKACAKKHVKTLVTMYMYADD